MSRAGTGHVPAAAHGSPLRGRRVSLVVTGVASELLYLLYFDRLFPLLRYYRAHVPLPALTGDGLSGGFVFLGCVTMLFGLLLLAWRMVRDQEDGPALGIILVFGAAYASTMVFMYPASYGDIYDYIARSWLMVHYHQNPLLVPAALYPRDPLIAMAAGHSQLVAEYGPVGLVVDAIPTLLAQTNLLATLLLLKVMFSAMVLATAYVAYHITRRVQHRGALASALLVAWNPLLVIQISGYGHNDAAVVLLALLALLSVVNGERLLAPALLTGSALIKFATGILLPLFFWYFASRLPPRRRIRYAAAAGVVVLAMVVISYAPFWDGWNTVSTPFHQEESFAGDSLAAALVALAPGRLDLGQMKELGRVLFIPCFFILLGLSARSALWLIRACFLTLLSFLALATGNVHTWYLVWPCVMGVVVPRPVDRLASVVLAYTGMLAFGLQGVIWPWLDVEHAWPQVIGRLNVVAYLVTFLPACAVLLAAACWRPGRTEPQPAAETAPSGG